MAAAFFGTLASQSQAAGESISINFGTNEPNGTISDSSSAGLEAVPGSNWNQFSGASHSPGSVTLKVEDVLFTGDTLFAGSCGRADLRGGSYEQIMQSLKRLGELKGDFHVCPGHEATSTLERERRSNPFLMEAMRS